MLSHNKALWGAIKDSLVQSNDVLLEHLVHTKPKLAGSKRQFAKKKQAKRAPKALFTPYIEPVKFRSMVRMGSETSKGLVHYWYEQIK